MSVTGSNGSLNTGHGCFVPCSLHPLLSRLMNSFLHTAQQARRQWTWNRS